MRYSVVACDYDGTIAKHGQVSQQTIEALERVVASGRKLLLVTGRTLEVLQRDFSRLDLFCIVVAEDGALLYHPVSGTEKALGEAPPEPFLQALRERRVEPLVTGRVIAATQHPYETVVLEEISRFGLERQIVFNKGAVMILPTGVNKGTGLTAALRELQIAPQHVVGVGDAEHDHSLLAASGYAVAVANALSMLKERADYVTKAENGEGVRELIERLLADDLPEARSRKH